MKKTIFTIIALLNINFLEACFSPDPKLGDSAYWAVQAIESYAAKDYEKSVAIVDECYELYVPNAVEIQNELGLSNLPSFLPPAIGFFLGAMFMFMLDKSIPHLHIFGDIEEAEGPKTDLKKTSLLVPKERISDFTKNS